MKLTLIAVASTVVTLSFSALAADMPGMKMDGMEGMEMKHETKQAPVATADGTVRAIDPTKHTETIAHGAVPSVQWPPMDYGVFRDRGSVERAGSRRPCLVCLSSRGWQSHNRVYKKMSLRC